VPLAEYIKVLLADRFELVMAGVSSLLQQTPDLEIVAEATDGRQALEMTGKYQPHVAVMEIDLPTLTGFEVTARIAKEFSHVRVVILSRQTSEECVWQALNSGAVGYVPKAATLGELLAAIRAAARGQRYLSPLVSKRVLDYKRLFRSDFSLLDNLTPRQRKVLQLIAEGTSTKQMAGVLGISVKTVETHRALMMERLEIYDVAGLVRYAIRSGLVSVA
jgi:DNA-binding NarL/FixJ family response regulator